MVASSEAFSSFAIVGAIPIKTYVSHHCHHYHHRHHYHHHHHHVPTMGHFEQCLIENSNPILKNVLEELVIAKS